MAIQNDVLQQQRMKNLAAITRGGCVGTGALAVHGVRPANIAMGAAPVAFLADGSYDATLAQTAEIDLSDVAVCAEGGDVIPSGNDVAIFIIHNGTAALARVGRHTRTMERSGVTGALTTVDSWLTFPEDVDMDTYICIGFAKFTTAADFTVGTTSLTDQTATYTNIRNLMPGTKIAAV
jgi:hypothetical protein